MVTSELRRVIRENVEAIEVEFKDQFMTVHFKGVPVYTLDPVICVALQELRKFSDQIQMNTLQNSLILGTNRLIQKEDTYSVKAIITNALEQLVIDVERLESLLV